MTARTLHLHGRQGIGKSMIAAALLATLASHGRRVAIIEERDAISQAELELAQQGADVVITIGFERAPADTAYLVVPLPADCSIDQCLAAEVRDVWTASGPLALASLRPPFETRIRHLAVDVSRLGPPEHAATARSRARASRPSQTRTARRPT